MTVDWKKFSRNCCYKCQQFPCDSEINKCPFAISAYLILTRDDDLCDWISQYLDGVVE